MFQPLHGGLYTALSCAKAAVKLPLQHSKECQAIGSARAGGPTSSHLSQPGPERDLFIVHWFL